MVSTVQPIRFVGPACLLAGLAVLGLALSRGEASLYLVVVVPVITGTGPLAVLGIVLIFAGFFATFLLWPAREIPAPPKDEAVPMRGAAPRPVPPRRWGGVVFLGPFPIVFGSDPRMARAMLLIGIVLFLALLVLTIYALLA